jgi:hypothetical protein
MNYVCLVGRWIQNLLLKEMCHKCQKLKMKKKMSKLKKLQKCSKAITKSVNVKNVELDQIKLKIH